MQAPLANPLIPIKLGMLALLVVSVPISQADLAPWAQWGLAGLVVGFTLWRDHERERRLQTQLNEHYAWTRDRLVQALERHTQQLERLNRHNQTT